MDGQQQELCTEEKEKKREEEEEEKEGSDQKAIHNRPGPNKNNEDGEGGEDEDQLKWETKLRGDGLTCEECNMPLFRDPLPQEMCLWLHALSYEYCPPPTSLSPQQDSHDGEGEGEGEEGGWKYTTDLPPWAQQPLTTTPQEVSSKFGG